MPIIEQVYFEGRIPDKYSHGVIVGLVTLPLANNYYAEGMCKKITHFAQKEFKGVSVDLAIFELSKL